MNVDKRPQVGLGVLIFKDGKALLGKRKGGLGAGTWCPPGGHFEFGESFEACARREVLEETGLHLKDIGVITMTNDIFEKEGKHYVTIFMGADYEGGEPKVMEPEKFEKMRCSHDTQEKRNLAKQFISAPSSSPSNHNLLLAAGALVAAYGIYSYMNAKPSSDKDIKSQHAAQIAAT